MSDLLLVAFPSEQKAEQGRRELLSMEKANLIAIEDAVIAVKKPDRTIRLDQLAEPGALWGIRAAASGNPAPIGAGALTDFGTNDKFVKDVAEAVSFGGAAILVLVWKMTADRVLQSLKAAGGVVLRTSFDMFRLRSHSICFGAVNAWRQHGLALLDVLQIGHDELMFSGPVARSRASC